MGKILVPYKLTEVDVSISTGTTLSISELRFDAVQKLDWKKIRTGSIGVVSGIRSLLQSRTQMVDETDPGFRLIMSDQGDDYDTAKAILNHYAFCAKIRADNKRLVIRVYKFGQKKSYISINDAYQHEIGVLKADIRFFPRRPGTFSGAPVDGRYAYPWIRDNSGVKVFDRGFQLQPYGEAGDDWLSLVRDAARNERHPQSQVTKTHFPMSKEVQKSTKLNWMLRLPESAQLVGVVEVKGRRSLTGAQRGLVSAADREGFVANAAFDQLVDIVRGAVEMIAVADRQAQQEEDTRNAEAERAKARLKTSEAIAEIEADSTLSRPQKQRVVAMLMESQERSERQEAGNRERTQQLEVMSLLGIVGGFMTHEFGTAIAEMRDVEESLKELAAKQPSFQPYVTRFATHIKKLQGFVAYSQLYIKGAKGAPDKPYPVRPRLTQVRRLFAEYAADRRITIDIGVEADVMAPRVPVSLYNGIAQNLLTNALKAVMASTDETNRTIALRAWNEAGRHYLQVSDTGIGIPSPVRGLVFDPLFTTTENGNDPLGSGMGLGLALVKRGAEAFGGSAKLVNPPPGFVTCVNVEFPIDTDIGVNDSEDQK